MSKPGEGIDVSHELLEQIRGALDGGSRSLEGIARAEPAGIDAGESTPTVAETLGMLLEASAGVAGGIAETAQDIQATAARYLDDDEAAADLFGDEAR